MKKTKRIISMILAVIMLSMTAIGVNAEEMIIGIDDLLVDIGMIDPSPEEELMPMAANTTCHNYDNLNAGKTMGQIAQENNWTLIYYTDNYGYSHAHIQKYDESTGTWENIGRYDITSSTSQEPHYHLFEDIDNIHYYVAY